ncbi:hypothetical protein CMI37_12645 [Candidatus Pacearchaeota archaeon]|jgi:hypothetical protein|nr:hypothetical protein [Candidatus Pacearchaeota archaeon]|tara:strand:- start:91 stop:420 length:330 start_codon:yes stop_codon:yes gene_type:complete
MLEANDPSSIEKIRKTLLETSAEDLAFLTGAVAMHIATTLECQKLDGNSTEQFSTPFQGMFDKRLVAMGLDSDTREAMGSMVLDILSSAVHEALVIEQRPDLIRKILDK